MNKKRVSEIIGREEIDSWKNNEVITITAGTGAGKSYFIKNILYAYAKAKNKKILFLIHRKNCVDQFRAEIERDNKQDVIDIATYQKLEYKELKKYENDLSDYAYIVCDEFHYFMSDASFNHTTDMSLDLILKETNCVKIFMSATAKYMEKFLENDKNLELRKYKLPINFNFIKDLTFYHFDETLDFFANEVIKEGSKAIFFIQSAEQAYNLYKKYSNNAIFNCGKSSKKYRKYVELEKISELLKNERFEENILITTSCMDAGVNIIDLEVKHIICDIQDIDVLTQCLGRKRIQNKDDKVYVYIKNIGNEQIGGLKRQCKKRIAMADYLKKNGQTEFIDKYPREMDYSKIIYDENDKNGKIKKVNNLMLLKNKLNLSEYSIMILNGKEGYKNFMLNHFGLDNYRCIEEDEAKKTLEEYLELNLNNIMLEKKDRNELIEKLDVKSNGKTLRKIEVLNGALEEQEINYRIVQFSTSRIVDGKKKNFKNAWKIIKIE